MIKTDEVIYASWCLSDNFGDKLSPYIVEKISGKKCVFSPPESDIEKYVVTGSILNWDIQKGIAWGAGVANKSDNVSMLNILAVRGEISKYFALLSGAKGDIAIGDPALLMPRLYTPKSEKKYRLGIFPHYIDSDIIAYNWLSQLPSDVVVIDPLAGIEETIDLICSCDKIISSSLHGLIVSDAYGIPNKWVRFSDRVLGDGTKFMDYYSSIKHPISEKFEDLRGVSGVDEILEVVCTKKELNIDLDKLMDCCPFKK